VPAGPIAQRLLRLRLAERLDEAAADAPDAPGAPPATSRIAFSVAVVDVDPASSRHPVGRERLLKALGSRLADATRPTDLVVRPTATRFVLVLSGARDSYGLAAARRRIRDVLSRPVLIDGCPVRSGVAVGVVPAGIDDTVEGLLDRLDQAATRDRRSARRLRSVGRLDSPS
jgi:GGDEF domain-containing protein